MTASILGWDIGKGAGGAAAELGAPATEPLAQIRLFAPPWPGAGCWIDPANPQSQTIDVWHLDPRLRIVFTCFRQLSRGATGANPKANVKGGIEVVKIVRGGNPSEGIIELPNPLTLDVLAGGGADLDDGCELSSGMQGVRIRVTAGGEGFVDHDVVATLIAIPNITFGCPELAKMAIERLDLNLPHQELQFLPDQE